MAIPTKPISIIGLRHDGDLFRTYFGIDPAKPSKPVKKDYNTVGVRFIYGHNLAKVYTYRVRKGAKLHLGQEVVVPSEPQGELIKGVAVVVRIDKTPQDNGPYVYKYITEKVAPL